MDPKVELELQQYAVERLRAEHADDWLISALLACDLAIRRAARRMLFPDARPARQLSRSRRP